MKRFAIIAALLATTATQAAEINLIATCEKDAVKHTIVLNDAAKTITMDDRSVPENTYHGAVFTESEVQLREERQATLKGPDGSPMDTHSVIAFVIDRITGDMTIGVLTEVGGKLGGKQGPWIPMLNVTNHCHLEAKPDNSPILREG